MKIAPGAPGHDAHWPSAAKNGFGTSNTLTSKVWFTLQGGVMTEVFYPRLDVPNTQTLQFVVVSESKAETESDDMTHRLEVLDSRALSFRQTNSGRDGAYGERPDGGSYDGRSGRGRLWVLLTGERGEYEVERGELDLALKRLDAMLAFANDGMMLPEQVWDSNESPRPDSVIGEGTGSATPLAWSMAQLLRLAINIQSRHNEGR